MKRSKKTVIDILSPKELKHLEKKSKKTKKRINRILEKKLKGWRYTGEDKDGNIVFQKEVYILDLKRNKQ